MPEERVLDGGGEGRVGGASPGESSQYMRTQSHSQHAPTPELTLPAPCPDKFQYA